LRQEEGMKASPTYQAIVKRLPKARLLATRRRAAG